MFFFVLFLEVVLTFRQPLLSAQQYHTQDSTRPLHTVILKLTLRHKTYFTDRAAASAASAASACCFRSFRRFYVSFSISLISYLV